MRKRAAIFFLLFGAAAFAIGVFQLFKLRFEVGDVYPPYSSLRSDPLGTMALFESLSRMPNVRVTRDFSSVNNLPSGQSCTYLHLAASRAQWLRVPEEAVQDVQNFLLEGGRLVIAFLPETSRSYPLAGPGGVRRGIPSPPAKPG
ncbi:MAG TPA: DUF4350 domain-containing protein, partial [Patescibacteria group bacterium]|nr:DUF4350 domain-containing protein [Patescibacteria group bacterium]